MASERAVHRLRQGFHGFVSGRVLLAHGLGGPAYASQFGAVVGMEPQQTAVGRTQLPGQLSQLLRVLRQGVHALYNNSPHADVRAGGAGPGQVIQDRSEGRPRVLQVAFRVRVLHVPQEVIDPRQKCVQQASGKRAAGLHGGVDLPRLQFIQQRQREFGLKGGHTAAEGDTARFAKKGTSRASLSARAALSQSCPQTSRAPERQA